MTPVLAVDDTRAHGPSARNWWDLAVDSEVIVSTNGDSVEDFVEQASLGGPSSGDRDLREILALLQPYQLRVRSITVHGPDGWLQGPLTVGMQRYFPIDHVSLAPLAYAHFGVEAVVSTPWLSDRFAIPPRAMRMVDSVDTELARNGWSLRPVSSYVRGDFLVCRSLFIEAGVAPELFVPTTGADEYNARFHLASGWSFGCANRSTNHRPKVSFEYKGRVRLHAGDAGADYHNSVGVGLQYDLGPVVAQLLASTAPGDRAREYWMFGLRLQAGSAKGTSP